MKTRTVLSHKTRYLLALIIPLLAGAIPVMAATFFTSQEAKLGPEITGDGAGFEYFGESVALSDDGTTALVGVPGDGPDGSVYVFVRAGSGWSLQAKLAQTDGSGGDGFGTAVSLSADGDKALIGANQDSYLKTGCAYVFVRTAGQWSQQAKLVAADGVGSDEFGGAVALSADGTTALIGAIGSAIGKAYIFVNTGGVWTQQAKLMAADAAKSDSFGRSVSLSAGGNVALVGAYGLNGAYVFVRDGAVWSQQAKLIGEGISANDLCGYSVCLSDDGATALVGATQGDRTAQGDEGCAYVFGAAGGVWQQQAKLTAADGARYDEFGNSVSLSGDASRALIGALLSESVTGSSIGSAYLFRRSGDSWSQEAKLTAEDRAQDSATFGNAVVLSGDGATALVGAAIEGTAAGSQAGSAYIFAFGGAGWSRQAYLSAGNNGARAEFGTSVSLDGAGETAIVGASSDRNPLGNWDGGAYIFEKMSAGWAMACRLSQPVGVSEDDFGWAVCLSSDGQTALVGVPGRDMGWAREVGSVHVFARIGGVWTEQAVLTASDVAQSDGFGASVGLSADGSTAVIGTPGKDTPRGDGAGCVYVFVRSGGTWSQQSKLTATDGAAYDLLGRAVTVSSDGNTVLAGAPYDKTGISEEGSAYVFQRTGETWKQQAKLRATDVQREDHFGTAVALAADGNTALVGSPQHDTVSHENVGSAYVFARSGTSWRQQTNLAVVAWYDGEGLGNSVALSRDGNLALIGAHRADKTAYGNEGMCYVFMRSGGTWSQQAQLSPADAGTRDAFGTAVALSDDGSIALIGAAFDDGTMGNEDVGSAYVFRLGKPPGYGLLTAERLGDGNVRLRYLGDPLASVVFERASSLSPVPAWTARGTMVADADGYAIFTDAPAEGAENFWRTRTGP